MANQDIVKNAVAEATKELMRQKTIDRISVTEICERSGLKHRNFYRYYHDKYEVVEWIYYHDYLLNAEHFEGWSMWDYLPIMARIIYDDPQYYRNAFQYKGQNSFRDCCFQYLKELLRQDYRDCYDSEEDFVFMAEHEVNLAFDNFVRWLSADPILPPDEFLKQHRKLFYATSRMHCALLEREPPPAVRGVPFAPEEPSRKQRDI